MDTPFELFGIECGPGWRPLVEPIYKRIQELNAQGAGIEITQIKESWGELCIYVNNAPSEIVDAINEAREKSIHICAHCGRPAERIYDTTGWIYTLCPDCLKKRGVNVRCTVAEAIMLLTKD